MFADRSSRVLVVFVEKRSLAVAVCGTDAASGIVECRSGYSVLCYGMHLDALWLGGQGGLLNRGMQIETSCYGV